MYLSECSSLVDTTQSLKRNSYQRGGTLTPNAKSPVDKKRFTFDESDTM